MLARTSAEETNAMTQDSTGNRASRTWETGSQAHWVSKTRSTTAKGSVWYIECRCGCAADFRTTAQDERPTKAMTTRIAAWEALHRREINFLRELRGLPAEDPVIDGRLEDAAHAPDVVGADRL